MGTVAIVWGILSLVGMLVALTPCLGSLNWLNIPFSGIGLILSIVAATQPENKSKGIAGIVMCFIAIAFGLVRLLLGGGVL